MTNPFRGKILNMAAISLILGVVALARQFLLKTNMPDYCMLIVIIPAWLGIGALMKNGTHTVFTRTKLLGFIEISAAVFLGWGLIGLFWFLPGLFPTLRSNVYGIEITLSRSPEVLLASMAFLMGFFSQASVKIFPAARKQVCVSMTEFVKRWSETSLKIYLQGIKGILFLSTPTRENNAAGDKQ
jgi:hypothetical protein